MKTTLITTTINVPTVLELYKQHGPDVHIIVAGDLKTPQAAADWCHEKGITYLSPGVQQSFGYKCSELIGWSCVQRRNIALLEAIKWGADIIVSIDDDNIPINRWTEASPSYFYWFESLLRQDSLASAHTFSGIKVSSPTGWFDVGQLLDPVAPHRGFPIDVPASYYEVSHVVEARVGVAAGICLGDPDISAVNRISQAPTVHRVSELLNAGIVVDPGTKTVFNSQNTAFIRELAPAFFMLPFTGRYDDIYASLIMQRVMRERNLHVHFGKPFVWQQRNQHNLVKDLRGELDGMEFVEDFATCLDAIDLGHIPSQADMAAPDVLYQIKYLWNAIGREEILPPQTVEAALAFLEDLEPLL